MNQLLFKNGFRRRRIIPVPVVSSIGGPGNDIIVNQIGVPGPPGPPGTLIVPVTIVTSSPTTATTSQYFLGIDVNGSSTITLPVSVIGKVFIIKDVSGNAFTNPITVTATSHTIDGQNSYVLNVNYGSITLVFTGLEWNIT
jgi:hypothetical protein